MSAKREPTTVDSHARIKTNIHGPPFVGRLGANQSAILNRNDGENDHLLTETPDAAPGMSLEDQFSLRPFRTFGIWKAAVVEGMGTLLFAYVSIWASISPNVLPTPPTAQLGYFDNAAYLGPTTAAISNFVLLTLFIFCFGTPTGAHLNPTITIATFCARLCTLPRLVLYISFQVLGATLGGLLVRASYGSRDFKTGGCWMFEEEVSVGRAFSIEFVTCTLFLFFVFGVGLDPRQQQVIPKSLGPFLVGLALGVCGWTTGYSKYGFGGASMNPARCFGTFVGSRFPGWHWYHWYVNAVGFVESESTLTLIANKGLRTSVPVSYMVDFTSSRLLARICSRSQLAGTQSDQLGHLRFVKYAIKEDVSPREII